MTSTNDKASRGPSRRTFLAGAAAAVVLAPATTGFLDFRLAPRAAAAVTLGADSELFADDVNILSQTNMVREIQSGAHMSMPLVRGDQAWEGGGSPSAPTSVYLYGSVLWDSAMGLYRMWYVQGGYMLHATSPDGLVWSKPLQPAGHPFAGTNRVFFPNLGSGVHGASVIRDDTAPASHRYRAMYTPGIAGLSAAFSADGLTWSEPNVPPALNRIATYGSEIANLTQDPVTGEYIAYIRPSRSTMYLDPPGAMAGRRRIATTTSTDFVNWTPASSLIRLDPDSIDDAWVTPGSQERTEFYGMSGAPVANQWLGIIEVFRVTDIYDPPASGQSWAEGPIYGQLVTSRDGRTWSRSSDRSSVIANGPWPHWDAGAIMAAAAAPVIVGDDIWWYYTGINTTHGGTTPPKVVSIGRASWKRDRMVGLRNTGGGGVIETVELTADPTRRKLLFNATIYSFGTIKAELVDSTGTVIPGYSAATSTVSGSDPLRRQLLWTGNTLLPAAGTFRIRFLINDGILYSYSMVAP